MKILRLSTIMAITLASVSGTFLFSTAQKVQQSEDHLRRTAARLEQEKQSIRVLRAEWDYLNRPDRLEALVERNLELIPVDPESVRADAADLPETHSPLMPPRKPAFSAGRPSPAPLQAIPAVMERPSSPSLSPAKPALPVPPQENSSKDFQKLLHDLSPAAGGDE